MTTTSNAGVSFAVDGKAVTESELRLIVTGSLEKIDKLTVDLSSVEQTIEKALNDVVSVASQLKEQSSSMAEQSAELVKLLTPRTNAVESEARTTASETVQ